MNTINKGIVNTVSFFVGINFCKSVNITNFFSLKDL